MIFFSLLTVVLFKLTHSELLSKHVCEFCHVELLRFSVFKKDLIEVNFDIHFIDFKSDLNFYRCHGYLFNLDSISIFQKQQRLNELLRHHDEKKNLRKGISKISNVKVILISDEEEKDYQEEVEEDDESIISEFSSSDSDDDQDQDFSIFRPIIREQAKPAVTLTQALTAVSSPVLKEYICDYCQHSFKAKQGLTRHVQSHLDVSTPWKCNQNDCIFAASSKKKLIVHKFYSHKTPLPINKTDYLEKRNVKSSRTGTDFICFCGTSFVSMFSLRAHKNRLHRNKNKCIFGCKNVQYVKTGHFLRHVKTKHPEMYNQVAKNLQAIKSTKSTPENDEGAISYSYDCDQCDFTTEKKASLKSHVKSHLPYDVREKFECDKCNKMFTRASSLRVHRQTIHEKIRRYKCSKCPLLSFKQQGHLSDHIALKHVKDGKKIFKCNLCDRRFLMRYMMNRHQRYKHKVDTAQLPTFRDLSGENKFNCSCGKEFTSKLRMMKHKIKHSEVHGESPEKMFRCPEKGCLNAFTQRCNLIRHQKAKGHLKPEEIKNLKFSCGCGDKFFSYRGYSYHCDKNKCKKRNVENF